jgi:hypothetical protein
MSLWTPSGEHRVGPTSPSAGEGDTAAPSRTRRPADAEPYGDAATSSSIPVDDENTEAMEELQRQLADAPADVVVANHCYGLFELAAVYLSQTPPRLEQARLAIDALGMLVDGLGSRLGAQAGSLQQALAQIRLAYVQMDAAGQAASAAQQGPTTHNGSEEHG